MSLAQRAMLRTNAVMLGLQEVQNARLEQAAQNLANATTYGFQGFYVKVSGKHSKALDKTIVSHVSVDQVMRNVMNGSIERTNNPFDVAIIGRGYFQVRTPRGDRYTRNGQFQVDVEGYLVNSQGFQVLSADGNGVFVGAGASQVNISRDGTVATSEGVVGKIGVFQFQDEQSLKPQGSLLFVATGQPGTPSTSYSLVQGSLEASNVSLMKEAISLMEIQRLFEQAQKIIDEYEQVQRKAINVSSKN